MKKFTYENIADNNFQLALLELDRQDDLTLKAEHELMLFKTEITKHYAVYDSLRMRLLDKYGKKDEKGKLTLNDEKTRYVLDNEAEFNKEFNDLCAIEIEIKPLSMSLFQNYKLTAAPRKSLMKFLDPQL